jgi:hypothetical protein
MGRFGITVGRLAKIEHIIFSERYDSSQIVQQYANLLERYISDKRILHFGNYFFQAFIVRRSLG